MNPVASDIERLNHLPVDLRAEVVVADLLENGVSLDDLILDPSGGFRRAFGRDIDHAEWTEAQPSQWLRIYLNRDGLYDRLPEGLFHQPTTNESNPTKDEWLREMALQQEREKAARLFFLPLEQEFFRQRVRIEQEERAYLPGGSQASPEENELVQFWNLPPFLTPDQVHRLLYLLPLVYRMAGDLDYMAACFEAVLEEPVRLQLEPPGGVPFTTETAPLGQWQLGVDSLLDGLLMDETPVVRLTVCVGQADRIAAYLPGGRGRQLIDWLGDYLFALDTLPVIDLDTSALERDFQLAEESPNTWLYFTTQL